ncbi:MAG: transposase, partial [Actinoallomurus sp.]|nr:transposase [Actinoallomurus sp.]
VHGHRGRKDDPLYSARRTLHTGAGLLTEKQKDRLHALFAVDAHVEVEATWGIYQSLKKWSASIGRESDGQTRAQSLSPGAYPPVPNHPRDPRSGQRPIHP